MAAPLKSGKQSVNLAGPVRVSRIRRDPPPIAKKIVERDPDERDTRVVVIGVVAFAIADRHHHDRLRQRHRLVAQPVQYRNQQSLAEAAGVAIGAGQPSRE